MTFALYTLTSVSICSSLFFIHFLQIQKGELIHQKLLLMAIISLILMTLVFRFTSDTAGEIRSQSHQGSMGKIHSKFTMNSKVVHNYSSSLSWNFFGCKASSQTVFHNSPGSFHILDTTCINGPHTCIMD